MSKIRLTLARWDYDRARVLADGQASLEAIDLNLPPLRVADAFLRTLRSREFET